MNERELAETWELRAEALNVNRFLNDEGSLVYRTCARELRAALASAPAATQGEAVALQHMAVAEDGVLRWMSGRKVADCELYAMPDFGRAPPLYATPTPQPTAPLNTNDMFGVMPTAPARAAESAWPQTMQLIEAAFKETGASQGTPVNKAFVHGARWVRRQVVEAEDRAAEATQPAAADLRHDVEQQIECLQVGLGGPEPKTELGKLLNEAIIEATKRVLEDCASQALADLAARQKPLEPEFAKLLEENSWDLMARSTPPSQAPAGVEAAQQGETEEVERLRELAATCYAGLGAECDLPEAWLDVLNAAANGEPFSTEGLLPYAGGQSSKDAARQGQAFDPAVPTNDRLRAIARQTRDRNDPSDTTNPAEYVLEGWREAEKHHGIHPWTSAKSHPQEGRMP